MSDPTAAPSSPEFDSQPEAADQPGSVDFAAPASYDPPAYAATDAYAAPAAPYAGPASTAPADPYVAPTAPADPYAAAPTDPYAAQAPSAASGSPAANPYATTGAQQQYPPSPYGQAMVPSAPYGIDPISGLPYSEKSKIVAGLLGIFLGSFGVGRFYMGNIGMGIAQIAVTWLTLGLGSLWPLIDGIMILAGQPKDSNGRPLRP